MSALQQKELEEARARWELFHAKTPRHLLSPNLDWPQRWELAGKGCVVYYSSDKWLPNGKFRRYFHEHDSGSVRVLHPSGAFDWLKKASAGVKRYPSSGTVLGFCLGWDLERWDTGEYIESVPDRNTLLCCFPDGSVLFTYHRRHGIQALFVGEGLRVEAAGIVG